jgi:hypothetical protein
MAYREQEPEITQQGDETIERHPAFGQIMVTRLQGGHQTLYGSDLQHPSSVVIRITGSELRRGLSRDWYYSRQREIEVRMSEAQWATFVSAFGIGEGVPCTIAHLHGEDLPAIPYRNSGELHRAEARKAAESSVNRLKDLREKVQAGVQGLSKTRAAEMLDHINGAISDLTSHLPFIIDSHTEHMEGVVEKAKAEVHAYGNDLIRRTGLQALAKAQGEDVELLRLGRSENEQ